MPITANFAGAKARKGGTGILELATGWYAAKTTETKNGAEHPNSVMVQTEIIEEGFAGVQRRVFLGTDITKEGNKNSWYNAAISHGLATEEELQGAGEIEIDEANFVDQPCFLFIKAKDANVEGSRENISFISQAAYEEGKAGTAPEPTVEAEAAPVAPAKKTLGKPGVKPAVAAAPPVPAAKPAGASGLKAQLAARKAAAPA